MRIYKYPLEITDEQHVAMPRGAKLLSVQVQRGVCCLWALVNEKFSKDLDYARAIHIVGTGNPTDITDEPFIGMVQMGQFMWHVFDGGER